MCLACSDASTHGEQNRHSACPDGADDTYYGAMGRHWGLGETLFSLKYLFIWLHSVSVAVQSLEHAGSRAHALSCYDIQA